MVHGKLHDLRLLYLAHQVEEAFEGLEKALERHIPSGPVRETLQVLFLGGPNHRKLEAALARLNQEVEARKQDLGVDDLLQALLDCERMAQSFYLQRMDDLSDPALVELFRGLAEEEGRHAQAVQRAMELHSEPGR